MVRKDLSAADPKREAINRQIEENLRKVYNETVSEALPDRFADLLAQLKTGEPKGNSENDR
nr:NepR family anti-sigma factor [Oceanicella sp. SM1341]